MASRSKRAPRDSDALRAAWQPHTKQGRPVDLSKVDPAAKPYSGSDKAADKQAADALAQEIDKLQELLFADRRFKLLVVLQGMDAAGKDGTIRGVFGQVSPLGAHTVSWKAPTAEEKAHDFLWRIHREVPGCGELVIFNRSHYEDVLVPVVLGSLTPAQVQERLRQINDFERMLIESGTVLLKFMLHVSPEEQRKRLQERIDDPSKAWKFMPGDLDVRRRWNDYMAAYGVLLGATSTEYAPWTIVPADSKTHRNLMIATQVRDKMQSLGLRYPPPDKAIQGVKVK